MILQVKRREGDSRSENNKELAERSFDETHPVIVASFCRPRLRDLVCILQGKEHSVSSEISVSRSVELVGYRKQDTQYSASSCSKLVVSTKS